MGSRSDDIRKKMEKRRKERMRMEKNIDSRILWEDDDISRNDAIYDYPVPIKGDNHSKKVHPLFRKELFMLKILGAAVLYLAVAILMNHPSEKLVKVESTIRQAMSEEFNFMVVADWYENTFGKPLAFLPEQEKTADESDQLQQYALSATGKVLEEFNQNRQRIAIETGTDTTVQAFNEGQITFIGNKEGFGKTVVIQHSDNSESWYGNLEEVDVKLYELIEKGTKVGSAANYDSDGTLGLFYFAIKENNDFIDPLQVIDIE
ncbi:M23 family metallopeptidase [Bacillus sp. B1-b2]|uniref:M23 family metallopeptidase n=1 Tax=Bacillus sp. B1-b2 TaxID=2653201 RepID=UPI0012617DE2|nr:M23 family metallopeptidase [Bacillus sp. B1-b2]KAB7667327.1 M23 family metallopeptidase [Bacillus sp. B1-b2]